MPPTPSSDAPDQEMKMAFFLDCDNCYGEIMAAASHCITAPWWKPCVEDILSDGNPCLECVCLLIGDISNIFNVNWSC